MLNTEQECIEYIHSYGRFGKKKGLSNLRALLCALGNPQDDLKFVHISGTNGKGSCACMMSNILASHGLKVGVNTSPYIERFNERLQINNQPIPSDRLIYYTNVLHSVLEKLKNTDCTPIEFEIITAIGFLYFRDEKCDIVVLECGIGGRLDSTNVIQNPLLSMICNIGIDHTEILGDTIEKIAAEKAGIIKQGSLVAVHPSVKATAARVIVDKCAEQGAKCVFASDEVLILRQDLSGTDFEYMGLKVHLNLLGSYQVSNAALCITASKLLGDQIEITDKEIVDGIANARWMCRFEHIRNGGDYIIDGAHNYQGICEFVNSVNTYLGGVKTAFVVGMLNEKDFANSACELAKLDGTIVVTSVPNPRQTNPKCVYNEVAKHCPNAIYEPDLKQAILKAKACAAGGYVCIAGSLYLAGEVRMMINNGELQ